ncbi:MAG: hypothetical protein QM760_08155 [Nibricoccus sp.]
MNTPVCTSHATCGCDSRFLLPVGLLATDEYHGVSACLRCGKLVCSAGSDSPNTHETLTPKALAWLNRWPRLLATPDGDFACLPAAVRCTTLEELEIVRSAAWNAQRHLPRGRRLNRAGWPMTPPPDSLPSALSHYRLLWEAAGFTSATDLDTLLYWAIPAHTLVSPLALNALLQRRDLRQLLPGLANSPVLHRRTVLCALAQEDASLVPVLRPHLQSWLQRHDRAADSPQKRVLSAEAELCRATLHVWQLARAFTPETAPAQITLSHEAALSAA